MAKAGRDPIEGLDIAVTFLCQGCGELLTVHGGPGYRDTTAWCPNCGAGYHMLEQPRIYQYGDSRPPSQWRSRGYEPTPES